MTSLNAKFILEVLGRPADHLKTALHELVDKMSTEKGVSVIDKSINDPKLVEKQDNLWTSFADIDLKFDTLPVFLNALMTYLPAHIEVYEPENFRMNAFEINEFANFIVSKLHNYDALAKRMLTERDILVNKLEFLRQGGDPKKVFLPEKKEETKPEKIAKNKSKKK